jgi:D-ribose pyranase
LRKKFLSAIVIIIITKTTILFNFGDAVVEGAKMKKSVLLNAPISRVVALMGHGDSIAIADAGLPVPQMVERIDLALMDGIPSFFDTVFAVSTEMFVESMLIAEEMSLEQPELHARLIKEIEQLSETQGNHIQISSVPHNVFKQKTQGCKAIVRSGECTPYSNAIFYSGVNF